MNVKEVLKLDSVYMLALAVSIWIPCLLQYGFDTAKVYLIASTFLFGTAYLIIARMITTFLLIYLAVQGKIEK
jgi:hypothetical protein